MTLVTPWSTVRHHTPATYAARHSDETRLTSRHEHAFAKLLKSVGPENRRGVRFPWSSQPGTLRTVKALERRERANAAAIDGLLNITTTPTHPFKMLLDAHIVTLRNAVEGDSAVLRERRLALEQDRPAYGQPLVTTHAPDFVGSPADGALGSCLDARRFFLKHVHDVSFGAQKRLRFSHMLSALCAHRSDHIPRSPRSVVGLLTPGTHNTLYGEAVARQDACRQTSCALDLMKSVLPTEVVQPRASSGSSANLPHAGTVMAWQVRDRITRLTSLLNTQKAEARAAAQRYAESEARRVALSTARQGNAGTGVARQPG